MIEKLQGNFACWVNDVEVLDSGKSGLICVTMCRCDNWRIPRFHFDSSVYIYSPEDNRTWEKHLHLQSSEKGSKFHRSRVVLQVNTDVRKLMGCLLSNLPNYRLVYHNDIEFRVFDSMSCILPSNWRSQMGFPFGESQFVVTPEGSKWCGYVSVYALGLIFPTYRYHLTAFTNSSQLSGEDLLASRGSVGEILRLNSELRS